MSGNKSDFGTIGLIDYITRKYGILNLLSLLPCGVSISTDTSCKTIIHNNLSAHFLRIKQWENFSHSADTPPPAKIFLDGKILEPKDMPIQLATWNGQAVTGMELEFLWPDGVKKVGLWNAKPLYDDNDKKIIGGIATCEDITERKQMELELLQHRNNLENLVEQRTSEVLRLGRLNLVGEMAASIGHEVRNPLTTVRGYLQWFMGKEEKYSEQFSTMIEELDRANHIITEFLSLAKNKAIELVPRNLNNIINSLFPLLQADAFRYGHEITTELDEIPDFNMDEKEIRQLILNLIKNSFDAMKPGGNLIITTCYKFGIVELSVSDTGTGIPQEILAKLGTPFITTKEKGTGLGLPICYRVAQRHNAEIGVNTSSEGTTFLIKFPV